MRALLVAVALLLLVTIASAGGGTTVSDAIVYAAKPFEGKGPYRLYVLDRIGGRSRAFGAAGAPANEPNWSPDRRRIAFTGKDGIYVIEVDGRNRRRVVSIVGADQADWAPDGRRLVFTAPSPNESEDLYRVNLDGSGLVRLTRNRNGIQASDAAWSPDGRWIAFARFVPYGLPSAQGIFVLPTQGGPIKRLTRGEDSAPAWSPDGREIAFSRGTDDIDGRIFAMNTRGKEIQRLTVGDLDLSPAWSPDGQRLVFVRDGQLASLIDRDGTNVKLLTPARLAAANPDW